jgi:hypothetical protein
MNGLAAKWAAEHAHLLPVDGRSIAPADPLQEVSLPIPSASTNHSAASLPGRHSLQSASESSQESLSENQGVPTNAIRGRPKS